MKKKLGLGFFLILLDQFSKAIAARISAVSHNSGIAFGLVPGLPTAGLIFLIAWLAFDGFRHRQLKVSEVIFLAGGISNILDRIWRGKVIDWMRISSLWFNLADVYIVLGMTLMIVAMISSNLKSPDLVSTRSRTGQNSKPNSKFKAK